MKSFEEFLDEKKGMPSWLKGQTKDKEDSKEGDDDK